MPILRQPTPSFQSIADRPASNAVALRQFLMTIRHTFANGTEMPNPQLTDDQAAHLASYIVSLRETRPATKP